MKTKITIREDVSQPNAELFNAHNFNQYEINKIIHHAFEAVRSVINSYDNQNNISPLRKLFIGKSYMDSEDNVMNDMVEECMERLRTHMQLPLLLSKRIAEEVIRTEIKVINKYFHCNSFSKLLRYFSVANSFMTNEYIRKRTIKKLEFAVKSPFPQLEF